MLARTETAEQRLAIYNKLGAHNRRIGLLRFGVPLLGLVVFLLLVAQLYLANIGQQFGIMGLTIDKTMAIVQAPRYSGVMSDGTAYRVTAGQAKASLLQPDRLELTDASIVFSNADGSTTTATSDNAILNTTTQQLDIAGLGDVVTSDGTTGKFTQSSIDWPKQTFTAVGGTRFDFGDGTTIIADKSTYDLATDVWTFSRVTVTMPQTPGELDATSPMENTP